MKEKWEVGFSGMSPGGRLAIIPKTHSIEQHIGKNVKYKLKWSFATKEEAEHFLNFLKLPILRFCLSIYKINQHLNSGELASVPYMPTYTRPWTDADVAKEIGLTEEELQWAIDWIPDYYPEDSIKYEIKHIYEI